MSARAIDFRSDTVTRPSAAMRDAMATAMVGDDVYSEDPSVNALEQRVADLLGKPAALFCSSGTQSNLLGLLAHCERGDEFIVGQEYHTYRYEAGGASVLGSVVAQTIEVESDGSLDLATVAARIKPDDPHFPRTRLLALENTHTGKVIEQDFMLAARAVADRHGLAMHLDGARLFNAVVASGSDAATLCQPFDSVSVCFSKGLGAPVGSLLCASPALIAKARRLRKMVGGGMRQAGILAAAINYAIDHHIDRLQDDHDHAQQLAEGLQQHPLFSVESVQTNMVYLRFHDAERAQQAQQQLAAQGILVPASQRMRLVTHLDINGADIDTTITAFKALSD
ncbi:low-specificity L-threonine aldolase [Idiomarina xiamenensis]|uniref:L-allo-threonine aldolase n=1 Tax=Idiomarina xiamenensis 10-D-4 TaxID=740709 RepID=K2KFK7_9GAMM|nr:low-specificity L-threonine aldolase [Idiomarina xiamenensis]EKE81449.1 L-allo-threonine aldolase [Idiomarina xiamenensis 10-D-4]